MKEEDKNSKPAPEGAAEKGKPAPEESAENSKSALEETAEKGKPILEGGAENGKPALEEAAENGGEEDENSFLENKSVSGSYREDTQFIDLREENTAQIQLKKATRSPAALSILVGPEDLIGASWPIEKAVMTIGRSSSLSDIYIVHASISRSHFQLIQDEGRIYIMDLKSTNKTFVDNQELKSYEKTLLKNGMQIRAGNIIFKFFGPGRLETFSTTLMQDKALTDALTGLANRRALERKGPEFFLKNKSLCLILFDVDKFKDINDTYGHLAGDGVLKELSGLVMTLVREGDMLFRYGGDEFCLFTKASFDIAKNISERICRKVEKHSFVYEGKDMSVTISVGAATRVSEDRKWEDIYKRADEASYRAKQAGRNQARF